MPAPFLPFARPSIGDAEVAAVTEVLRSGWITTGARCAALEAAVAERLGAEHVVALSSATAGMHLTLVALGIGPGDEVVTPSMTWVSTVNLITLVGATPVFVDVGRDDLMVRAEAVEAALGERTRAVVPVHFAGASLDLDGLRQLAERREVRLVEDAAHAFGTHYAGRPIGSSGTSILSLHPIKNLTSIEGGLLCTDDGALAERVRRLRFHGLGADTHAREVQGRSPQAEVLEPGFKYNLPDVNAALALAQLERLDDFVARRAELARAYREVLSTIPEVQPLALPDDPSQHAWHLLIVRLREPERHGGRARVMQRLAERGIGTGIHFRAVHGQAFYRDRPETRRAQLPNTEWNDPRLLSLPLFPDMSDDDVARVADALQAVLR